MTPKDAGAKGLAAAAALAVAAGLSLMWIGTAPDLAFEERRDLPGFRSLVGAETGLTGGTLLAPAPLAPAAAPPDAGDLCGALFADPGDPVIGAGPVPVALFSDYRCPYCRVLAGLVQARAEAGAIRAVIKEWPILGPESLDAARMALAAHAQGGFADVHARLMRTAFVPTEAYAREVAAALGLDAGRLVADMEAEAVESVLTRVDDLARVFGFRGTPGLVVGRTVVEGAIGGAELDALIAEEARTGGCRLTG